MSARRVIVAGGRLAGSRLATTRHLATVQRLPQLLSATPAARQPWRLQLQPPRCSLCSAAPPSFSTAEEWAEDLSEMYVEARELMEDAEESLGKVYFEDDLNEARECIDELLARFERARSQLPPAEASQLNQIVGLKMEELRSRLASMDENLIHDDD